MEVGEAHAVSCSLSPSERWFERTRSVWPGGMEVGEAHAVSCSLSPSERWFERTQSVGLEAWRSGTPMQ